MATEREKMILGEMYNPLDEELSLNRLSAKRFARQYLGLDEGDEESRQSLLKLFLGRVGNHFLIETPFKFEYGYNVLLGENFYANVDCYFLDVCPIDFGNNVMIGPGVHVYTATHPLDPTERNSGKEYGKPVRIGNNVWIGGRSVIMPGVELGDNVVVAGGSVVTKSFSDNVVIGGNPAKVIKKIP